MVADPNKYYDGGEHGYTGMDRYNDELEAEEKRLEEEGEAEQEKFDEQLDIENAERGEKVSEVVREELEDIPAGERNPQQQEGETLPDDLDSTGSDDDNDDK